MYIRTIKRKNKDGSVVEYVQLAHNVRHPEKGYPKAEVIHSFGRREQLDVEGLKRLVASIGRFVEIDEPNAEPVARFSATSIKFLRSQPVGGPYLLQAIWDYLQIGDCLKKVLGHQSLVEPIERVLLALVANGALGSHSAGLPVVPAALGKVFPGHGMPLENRRVSQVVDDLDGHTDAIQQKIFRAVASRLKLGLDPVFVCVIPGRADSNGFEPSIPEAKQGGASHHGMLPEGTIGMAVSQTGIPLRCWSLAVPRIDRDVIDSVQTDLAPCDPGRIVWVMDRRITGHENQGVLRRAGSTFVLGEKLRDSHAAVETLKRKGRFKILGPDLQIKSSLMGEGMHRRQCVIAYHPGQAAIDRNAREQTLQRLRYELEGHGDRKGANTGSVPWRDHALGQYIKRLRIGTLKIDVARVRREEKHDGKYLLVPSDEGMPPETVAWAHKRLLDIVRADEESHSFLVLPPSAYARGEDVSFHTFLRWLTLLLTRIAEVQTGLTWPALCREMQCLHLGEFYDGNRRVIQYTEPTPLQKRILKHLKIDPPRSDSENPPPK